MKKLMIVLGMLVMASCSKQELPKQELPQPTGQNTTNTQQNQNTNSNPNNVIPVTQQNQNTKPNTKNYTVDLSLPRFAALNAPNNYVYIPAESLTEQGLDPAPNVGVRGLIVYRASFTQFNAYDRSCPYQTATSCAPIVVINAFTCSDTCKNCGSQFNLTTGSVSKGPSNYPLTAYQTTFDGTDLVRIAIPVDTLK